MSLSHVPMHSVPFTCIILLSITLTIRTTLTALTTLTTLPLLTLAL